MNSAGLLGLVGGVLVASVGGLVTYLIARRNASGRVDTSPAELLWAEADKLRQTYREESEKSRQETIKLREQVEELRKEVEKLRVESEAQRAEAQAQRAEAQAHRAEAAILKEKLDQAYRDLHSRRGHESGNGGDETEATPPTS